MGVTSDSGKTPEINGTEKERNRCHQSARFSRELDGRWWPGQKPKDVCTLAQSVGIEREISQERRLRGDQEYAALGEGKIYFARRS